MEHRPQPVQAAESPRQTRVTGHAVDRYIDRVDRTASRRQAAEAISQIVGRGHVRSTPRHWMRGMVHQTPGLRFIYLAAQPDVCALVIDGAVVTIITKRLCRHSQFPVIPGDVVKPIYCSTEQSATLGYGQAA